MSEAMSAYFHGDFTEMERLLDANSAHAAGTPRICTHCSIPPRKIILPGRMQHGRPLPPAHPAALLARLKSAESAMERGQNDSARPEVMSILAERPQSEMALQLAFSLSRHNQVDAPALLGRLLESHPSCARLADAVKFYNSTAEQDKARRIEQQLTSCAPESLYYARLLAESGRHGAAAAYLQQLVAKNPFHRAARRFLVEQLALDNQTQRGKSSRLHS